MKNESLLFNIHPGEILQELLDDLGLTQTAFAKHIKVLPKVVNEICRKKRGISPEMAVKFGQAFDMSPEYWLNAQQNYNLSQVKRSKLKSIKKLEGVEAA